MDQESAKVKSKKSNEHDLLTYITKLEQLVVQKRSQIVKERRKFVGVIQSLAKYLDMKGISSKIVEEFLDSVYVPPSPIEEDEIADWYAFLESKRKKPTNGAIINPQSVELPKAQQSNIIRISKQDLPLQPQPKLKAIKKIKKENSKMIQSIESQQKSVTNENNSKQVDMSESNNKVQEVKQKRKRRTKKEMLEAKQCTTPTINPQLLLNAIQNHPELKQNGSNPQIATLVQQIQDRGVFDLKEIFNPESLNRTTI